jgi:hypothetical protein
MIRETPLQTAEDAKDTKEKNILHTPWHSPSDWMVVFSVCLMSSFVSFASLAVQLIPLG